MLFCKNEITYTSTLEIYVFFSLENMLEYAKPGSFLRQRKSRRKWIRLQRKLYSGLPLVQPFNSDYSKEIKKILYIGGGGEKTNGSGGCEVMKTESWEEVCWGVDG